MPSLFDLSWVTSTGTTAARSVAHSSQGGTQVRLRRFPALILYPSFFTPALITSAEPGATFLDLLIVRPIDVLKPQDVNERLVISRGLAASRVHPGQPLFPALRPADISIAPPVREGSLLRLGESFSGVLHPMWRCHVIGEEWGMRREPYRRLCEWREGKDVLPPTIDELREEQWKGLFFFHVRIAGAAIERAIDPSLHATPALDEGDRFLRELFRTHKDAFSDVPGALAVSADYEMRSLRSQRRLLCHHPVAVVGRASTPVRRIAHLTDLHLNVRQDILGCSNARVVDAPSTVAESPELGPRVHRYHDSVGSILQAFGRLREGPQLLLVGGDLVDHIRNAVLHPNELAPQTAGGVWERVDLSPAGYRRNYNAGGDFVAAHSLLRRFMDEFHVPIMGVSGNHDAYVDAYGISPRASGPMGRVLGNEGIPADHNLTFLEALLVFGPSFAAKDGYGHVRRTQAAVEAGSFNFHWEWMDWFHGMFTPFSDSAIRVNEQTFVNLGWGNAEQMLALFADEYHGQGMLGHLPRASDALNADQLHLLRLPAGEGGKVVNAHFTIASFTEALAETTKQSRELARPRKEIRIEEVTDPIGRPLFRLEEKVAVEFTQSELGTFEKLRSPAFNALLDPRTAVRVIVTGHSHRCGLYLIKRIGESTRATMQRPSATGWTLRPSDSVPVLLSDSAGPLPRRNADNEFASWGSASPAGSLLGLDQDGRLVRARKVVSQSVASKPRVAVAMDYLDHRENRVWGTYVLDVTGPERGAPHEMTAAEALNASEEFGEGTWDPELSPSYWPGADRWGDLAPPRIGLRLAPHWQAMGVSIAGVIFIGRSPARKGQPSEWYRIPTRPDAPWRHRTIDRDQIADLEKWLRRIPSADRYLAVRFERRKTPPRPSDAHRYAALDAYDWGSWWIFGVDVAIWGGGIAGPPTRFRVTRRVSSGIEVKDASRPGPWTIEGVASVLIGSLGNRVVLDEPDFAARRATHGEVYGVNTVRRPR